MRYMIHHRLAPQIGNVTSMRTRRALRLYRVWILITALSAMGWQRILSICDTESHEGLLPPWKLFQINRIDLLHWRHVSITTTSRLVALRAHVVLAERIGPRPLSQCAGPGQPGGMACRGWRAGCMLGDGRTWQCHVWPPTRLGALLWRHMHNVY